MRRYLDYGKRVKSGQGMGELYQWVGKILLDDGQVYALEDRALAFEIAASEWLADQWDELQAAAAEVVVVSGEVDKTLLYRHLLSPANSLERRTAFADLLASRYRRNWSWIDACAAARRGEKGDGVAASMPLFSEFLNTLEEVEPLTGGPGGDLQQELEQAREEAAQGEGEITELRQDLEFAEERASRAHQRLRKLEEEERQLRRQLRDLKESTEKLRQERSRRIKLDRQAIEVTRELERLRQEYVKQEQRLQQMALRLAAAEQQRTAMAVDLGALRQLGPAQVLGVKGPLNEEEISRKRRQFAIVFHSDRVRGLPAWVGKLFDEILSMVNEACDRARR